MALALLQAGSGSRRGSVPVINTDVVMKTKAMLRRSCAVKGSGGVLLALVALAFATCSAPGAVIEAWVQRYNAPANNHDEARAVAVDRSGNVVVTGKSSNGTNVDFYTAKYA